MKVGKASETKVQPLLQISTEGHSLPVQLYVDAWSFGLGPFCGMNHILPWRTDICVSSHSGPMGCLRAGRVLTLQPSPRDAGCLA